MLFFSIIQIFNGALAQETNSEVTGKIITDKNELITGATVTAVHEPTKSVYVTTSRADGSFHYFNLKPGGPYTFAVTHSGYVTERKDNIFLNIGHINEIDEANGRFTFILRQFAVLLNEVHIEQRYQGNTPPLEFNISEQQLLHMPSISRNLQDFIRTVPQAKVNGDGSMSLAGQNPRFNAFFIDGANNNDILGQAQSGTNGGQTGTPPVSLEALEEIKVMLAPDNVQYGNFTGGSINAITRSGSNEQKACVWYYFRNEKMAGRSPVPVENIASPGTFGHPRLSKFFNQTAGAWISGPIIKNKLFYFSLFETQRELRPQPFNIAEYRGNSNIQQLTELADKLKTTYGYDAGSFLENQDKLDALRIMGKIDWNPGERNKITLTCRYNVAERTAPPNINTNTLNFRNGNLFLPAHSFSGTLDWKLFARKNISNLLQLTLNNEMVDRRWIGQPFPRVSIIDGNANIVFGSAPGSGVSLFKAKQISFSDVVKFIAGRHSFATGIEANKSRIEDIMIPQYFGFYQFRNLTDFMTGAFPSRFQRSFSLLDVPHDDQTIAGARYNTLRLGYFINDEFKINSRTRLSLGIRLDKNSLPTRIFEDKFFNDTALNVISNYYQLQGARSGIAMRPHLQISPRAGIYYSIPAVHLTMHAGAGIFAGHILNIWSSLLHNNSGVSIGSLDINPQQYSLHFNPDPNNQPAPQTLGINISNSRGELDIISKHYKYPSVFRSTFSISKQLSDWIFSCQGIFSLNIHETKYTNINILPPSQTSLSAGSRNVYSLNAGPNQISLVPNKPNPYPGQIFLMSNNDQNKGWSYDLTFEAKKQFADYLDFEASYTYGRSVVLFEPSFNTTSYTSQWRLTESVNGRNFVTLSTSDYDLKHKVFASILGKASFGKKHLATYISLAYNGQSGSPYSYVYLGSIVNDNSSKDNYDLIYIPTAPEVEQMFFVPYNSGATTYSAQQQKQLFNDFIESDKYLSKHRGEFSQRNAARLPFSHIIDLHVEQEIKIRVGKNKTSVRLSYAILNFANMLSRNWGRLYFVSGDNFPLVRFMGFASATDLTPKYQFTPIAGTVYSIQSSTLPGNSARWICQVGIKLNLN